MLIVLRMAEGQSGQTPSLRQRATRILGCCVGCKEGCESGRFCRNQKRALLLLACPLLTVPSTKKKSSSGQNQRSSMQSLLDMCISRLSSRPELLLRQGDLPMDDLVELILNGAGVSRLDEALLSTLHASLLAIGSDARCLDHAWHRLLQRDFPKKATCESGWRDVYLNESAAKRARFDAAKARVLSSQTQQAARSRIKRSKISVKS